jgi:ABC-type phosphate/phosphonate transport system substrate-binding protein
VVDSVSLHCYEQVKPGCFARLRVLHKSECFPAAVIVYRKGALDADTLERFKSGMITANQNERGRELMTLWKLTAFEAVPDDFEQVLAGILKTYPTPTVGGAGRTNRTSASPAP